ncbi:MAG: hypothetical protein QM503_10980 [Bacteroidota bacterium]
MKLLHKTKVTIFAFIASMFLSVGVGAAPLLDPLTFDPQIADVTTDITTAGTALIGLAIVAMSVRWVKATFF